MIINLPPRTLMIIASVFALLSSITLIFAVLQWQQDWALAHYSAPPRAPEKKEASLSLITALPDLHLFGQAYTRNGNMPTSNLQLKVTGIVDTANTPNSLSKAYISISGQPDKIYKVGDTLPYGVKVYAITPDAVILENDGHLEKLPLPRAKLEFKQSYRGEG